MTIEKLLEKYKRKYPGVPYERSNFPTISSRKNNEFHSYNDAPAIVYTDEAKFWYYKGKKHRENDKPAFIDSDGAKYWYYEDEPHRENDKPAVIYPNGRKEYWYKGERYYPFNPEEEKKQIKRLTPKKTKKQKQREDLLKEFVCEIKSIYIIK